MLKESCITHRRGQTRTATHESIFRFRSWTNICRIPRSRVQDAHCPSVVHSFLSDAVCCRTGQSGRHPTLFLDLRQFAFYGVRTYVDCFKTFFYDNDPTFTFPQILIIFLMIGCSWVSDEVKVWCTISRTSTFLSFSSF